MSNALRLTASERQAIAPLLKIALKTIEATVEAKQLDYITPIAISIIRKSRTAKQNRKTYTNIYE